MSEFSAADYFARAAQAAAEQENTQSTQDKYLQLQAASAEKVQLLGQKIERIKQRELANQNSWVTQLGLDPDSKTAEAVNLGASVYSGASRLAGDLTGLLGADAESIARLGNLSNDEISAIGRYKQGTATPEDVSLVTAKRVNGGYSPLEHFDLATKARERSADINKAFDRSAVVHSGNRDDLSDQLGANFEGAWNQTVEGAKQVGHGDVTGSKDLAFGLAKLIYNAGEAAVDNPKAAAEYVVENAPQLFVGAAGRGGKVAMGLSNAGYASEYYQQGLQKYQADNGGALPPPERRQEMALMAAGMALAEHAADSHELAGALKVAKAADGSAVKVGAKEAFKNTLKAAGQGLVEESATEGYQTMLEHSIVGDVATPKELYEAAVIGGLSGAGLTGGGRAVAELTKATPEHAQLRELAQTRNEAQKAAISSGDVSALTDPKNELYDPARAVAALAGHAAMKTTDESTRQKSLAKASEIIQGLETEKSKAQEAIDKYGSVDGLKTMLADAKKSGDKESIQVIEESMADVTSLHQRVSKIERRLEQANASFEQFHQDLHADDVDVEAQVAKIKAGDNHAADTLINLSMAVPERLDTKVADDLVADSSNALTSTQRDYLRSFSAARVAENQLKDLGQVSHEVYAGGNGNVGLVQYRDRITAAMAAGNQDLADQHLATLAKFAADHQAKAEVVAQAWEQGKGAQVIKTRDGRWEVAATPRPHAEVRRNGGLTLNTPALVSSIKTESAAINATLSELKAARALKFSGAKHVSNVPKAHAPAQVAGAAQQEAQNVAGNAASGDAGPASDAGRPASVEAARVTPEQTSAEATVNAVDQASRDAQATSEKTPEASPQKKDATAGAAHNNEQQSASEDSLKPAEQAPEQVEQSDAVDSGKLTTVPGFTQSASKEGDVTKRPLVVVKDFLSSGFDRVKEFLGLDQLSDSQQRTLDAFQKIAKQWQDKIQANLARKSSPEFYYEDLMQHLMQETAEGRLDVEENLKTAIAYAAFSWVAENVTKPAVNTDEEINAILGRDENAPVNDDERRMLGMAGVRQNVVLNGLGQKAAQALGLQADNGAHQDLGPRMESALGVRALALLIQEGIVQRTTLTGAQMAALTGGTYPENQKFFFVKLARDEQFKLTTKAEQIFDLNRGSQSVLDKLFGVESGLRDPVFDPKDIKAQKGIRNTRQKVPAELAKIIEHENGQPNHLRQDMWHLVEGMGENLLLQIAGWEAPNDKVTHKANRLSQQAKNDGLARELANFVDFVKMSWTGKGLDAPIYLEHVVWKQQRVGIATNTVNPQTSKIHRHMLFRPDWATEIDPANQEQLENFHLRVLEGLGVKTDKQGNEKSLAQWDNKVANNPVIQDAVDAIAHRIGGGELSLAQQQAIVAGVTEGGEAMHSLDALVALAHEKTADGEAFTVHLMGEVDGVTNGPMLTHLLLGAASTVEQLFALLNKGGFYQQGSPASNYNVWRGQAGHTDLYESTARSMNKAVQGVIDAAAKKNISLMPVFDALYAFTGTLVDTDGTVLKSGRNIVKTPLTAMVFGSAVGKSIDSMAEKFIEGIYGAIEDAAAGKKNAMTTAQIITAANTLLAHGRAEKIPANLSIEQLMEYEFKPKQINGLKNTFSLSLGKAMGSAIESEFADFIGKRQTFNQAAQLAFELHNAVYTALRQQLIAELVAKGELPTRTSKKGEVLPLHDLTPAQEAELRKRLVKLAPVLNTKFSQDSGSLGAGLTISKGGRKLSQDETYGQEVKFGTEVDGVKSITTHAFQQQESNPGVAMLPMSVHSLDSFISHTAALLGQVLNIHDAHGAGVGTFTQTARNLNQATWNAMLGYSPASQMAEAVSRTVVGLASLLEQKDLPPAVHANLRQAMEKMAKKLELESVEEVLDLVQQVRSLAFQADSMKLQALSQMQAIDQYALEGGQYDVTDGDRAAAAARLAALTSELTEQEQKAIEAIGAALQAKPEAVATEQPTEPDMNDEDKPAKASPFGRLGAPNIVPDLQVANFFLQHDNVVTVKQAIAMLQQRLQQSDSRHNRFQFQLLRLIAKTVPDMKIRMITPDTAESAVLAKPVASARGWFVSQGIGSNHSEINVLSTDYVACGLTVETLLHELTHGALSVMTQSELRAEQENPKYRSETLQLIGELDELREKALAYTKQNGITGFAPALENVHELIAWGMTDQKFQREVLAKISMKSRTEGTGLVNGMKAFIEKVVGILFAGSSKTAQEQAINGMTVLVSNVSGLFAAAAEYNGPNRVSVNLSQATTGTMGALQDYSTTDIHDALNAGALTPAFNAHLRDTLGRVVEKLHGAYGTFKAALMKQQAITPLDVWLKALNTGAAPFASSVQASPFVVSEREAHAMDQVEATVQAALEDNSITSKTVYRELAKLYREVSAKLTPADFNSQAEYDFVFKIEGDTRGRSDHLARFVAFGLANEQFAGKLGFATEVIERSREGKTFSERVQLLFEQVLEFFQEQITRTYSGQQAAAKLSMLVGQLVDIEAKRLRNLDAKSRLDVLEPLTNAIKGIAQKLHLAPGTLANTALVRNNRFAVVRAAGAVVRVYVNDQVDGLMQGITELRDKNLKGKHGLAMQLLTDIRGPGKVVNALMLASTSQQRQRKAIIDNTGKFSLQAFANAGVNLTRKHKAAISAVFLRTGSHVLSGSHNMTQLEQLLGNEAARNAAIADVERRLNVFGRYKDHFIHQANALAYFRVTGQVKLPKLMMNARNIARLYGTGAVGKLSEQQSKQAEAIIEQLVALYALGYTKQDALDFAKDVLRTENQRTDGQGNGVEFVLALHKRLEQESKDRLFQGEEALMMHGYTPEIYNPHTQVKTANAAEGKQLELEGYTKVGDVQRDPADPDKEPKALYALKDGGLQPYLTGVMSFTGKNTKGSTQHSGFMNVHTADGLANASLQADIDSAKPHGLSSGPRRDLSKPSQTFMAPVVNPHGEIVNWRYMMLESTKDSVLERTNDFEKIIGALAGSIYDKESTTEINSQALEAIKEQYDAEKGRIPDSYVSIGPKSTDPDLVRTWNMLPDETKSEARRIFGRDGIYARKDQLTVLFGYRKFSLSEMFHKDPDARGHMEKLFVGVIEHVLTMHGRVNKGLSQADAEAYAKRGAVTVAKAERMWQELVHEVKDIMVVKSGVVMMGNIWSNLSLLSIQGVPLSEIVKGHLVAMRGARAYQLDSEELAALQARINTGTAGANEPQIRREIARLTDAIARNPVKSLIDAGLMPTIVEDVSGDDPYSYKSALVRKTERFAESVNPKILALAKGVYMTHDTKIYQSLSRITQLSDFVARYTLYQHLTTKKKEPMSHEDAIHEASEQFINYDIPMPQGMQYMDDMGITMFTKYFLRIQRVLLKLAHDHPARVLMARALTHFLDLGSIVLDSSAVHKVGNNPIYSGALQLPGTLDELATVHSAMALIK